MKKQKLCGVPWVKRNIAMKNRTRSSLLWLLILLVICMLAALLDLPGIIKNALYTYPLRQEQKKLYRQAEFLQKLHQEVVKQHGSFDSPIAVEQELETLLHSSAQTVEVDYVVAQISYKVYVAQVPQKDDRTVCVLKPDGSVLFLRPSEELVLNIISESQLKNLP